MVKNISFPSFVNSDIERFMSKVKYFDHNGCWEWTGFLDKNGYGRMRLKGKYFRAHRLSYYFSFGNFENSLLVCHKCDNPTCVNPDHLFLGTTKDNARDMVIKKRGKEQKRTHCLHGHELMPNNIYYVKGAIIKKRRCRKCDRDYHMSEEYKKRRRENRSRA